MTELTGDRRLIRVLPGTKGPLVGVVIQHAGREWLCRYDTGKDWLIDPPFGTYPELLEDVRKALAEQEEA